MAKKVALPLRTKELWNLEKMKEISVDYKPRHWFDWLRLKLTKRYLEKYAQEQNLYNEEVYQTVNSLYLDIRKMELALNGRSARIAQSFFDRAYFEGGTKSTYLDYAVHEVVFKEFASILQNLFRPKKVFDVGCAYGFLVKNLRKLGITAWGIDLSDFAVQKANSRFISMGDISSLRKLAPNSYDLITCTEVLEHLRFAQIITGVKQMLRVSSRWVVLTIATKEEEKILDLSHVSVYPREFWDKEFKSLKTDRDFVKEKYLDSLPFSTRTGWKKHYFVLKKQS